MIDYQPESREAWESVERGTKLGPVDRAIVAHIADCPSTSEEVEIALGLKHQTVSAQIRHLKERGVLVKTEDRRPTRSGRPAVVIACAPTQAELL